MRSRKLERYHQVLLDMRDRLVGRVNHVVEAIKEDVNPVGNLSGTPLHMADAGSEALDADVEVLETERRMLEDIRLAIGRFEEGTFGKCEECGRDISEQRLDAIPYTPLCIDCARAGNDREATTGAWART